MCVCVGEGAKYQALEEAAFQYLLYQVSALGYRKLVVPSRSILS